ncbi:hypothetical protein BDV29DRAFT_168390 [Aspergillus leporis]|uniref:Peptidase inhibitor I78 family-domain-containing protein n=1 Tax=Aspergillus leporis TaxID=41062 RepID=A0A5N5XD29_9EURO|nr:hypothetical protein BDV29DRAFT_168390 [Aspergillus leporis]
MRILSRTLLILQNSQSQQVLFSVHTRNIHHTMPLVVPGVNNVKGDKNEWLNKLAGKTITEETSDVTSFAKRDLPEPHRILNPGDMKTMDHKPDRLNVHLDESGTVHDVSFG